MVEAVNYANLKQNIVDLIKEKKCATLLVRLAWHDAGTFCKNTKTGGPHGCMRFAPVKDHAANNGLDIARGILEPLKEQYPAISYADLWAFAGVVAVEYLGGPKVPFRPGRIDGSEKDVTPDGRLPDATKGADHLREIFNRMGFNDQEIVCLSGAHTLGRCHADRSGFIGPWTADPNKFDNEFYVDLFNEKWEKKKNRVGNFQYDNTSKKTMMLPTDMAVVEDPKFKPYAEAYAKDSKLFYDDFSKVFQKLLELGVEDKLGAVSSRMISVLVTIFLGFFVFAIVVGFLFSSGEDKESKYNPLTVTLLSNEVSSYFKRVSMKTERVLKKNVTKNQIFTSKELNNQFIVLYNLIHRDFITSWAVQLSKEPYLEILVSNILYSSIESLKQRIERVNVISSIASKAIHIIKEHFNEYKKAESALRATAQIERRTMTQSQYDSLLISRYNHGNIHPAAVGTEAQQSYLRKYVGKVLYLLFPAEEISIPLENILLRELLASTILYPVLSMISSPDFINQNIDYATSTAIKDLNLVNSLKKSLDRQLTLNSKNKTLSFDQFLKLIKKCKSLEEAKRIRNHIVTEIKKRKMQIENLSKDDLVNGKRVEEVQRYINRLFVAKKKADSKISELGGVRLTSSVVLTNNKTIKPETSLPAILQSPIAYQYFYDFMVSQSCEIKLDLWRDCERLIKERELDEDFVYNEDDSPFYRDQTEFYLSSWFPKCENLPKFNEIAAIRQKFIAMKEKDEYSKFFVCIKMLFDCLYSLMLEDDFPKFFESDVYYRYISNPESYNPAIEQNLSSDDDAPYDVDEEGPSTAQPTFNSMSDTAINEDGSEKPVDIDEVVDSLTEQINIINGLLQGKAPSESNEEAILLEQSRDKLVREKNELLLKKQQETTEKFSIVAGQVSVDIVGCTTGEEERNVGSNSYVIYMMEVKNYDPITKEVVSGWMVARRYSEFHAVHTTLRAKFPFLDNFDFPGKRVIKIFKKKNEFVEERRQALEKYIKKLLIYKEICNTDEFRFFLCDQRFSILNNKSGHGKRFSFLKFSSPTSPSSFPPSETLLDDYMEKLRQENKSEHLDASPIEDNVAETMRHMKEAIHDNMFHPSNILNTKYDARANLPVKLSVTETLVDLFIDIFELKEKNNWLRKQAVLLILQQILGGAIERKLMEHVHHLTSEEMVLLYMQSFKSSLWDKNDEYITAVPVRTESEMRETKILAQSKLSTFIPEILGGVVGRHNAKQGAIRIFQYLQNEKLNAHLVYSLLDQIFAVLFPEVQK